MTSDGNPDDRWPGLAAIITIIDPTVLLIQEAHAWQADPRLHALRCI